MLKDIDYFNDNKIEYIADLDDPFEQMKTFWNQYGKFNVGIEDDVDKYIVTLKNKKLTIKLAIQELPDGKNKFILRREYNLEDKAPKEWEINEK